MKHAVEKNLKKIRQELAPLQPNIVAVTKYFGPEAIIAAYQAGLRDFAESRVVEAHEKIINLPVEIRKNSRFHLIGHLQSNKVKKAVAVFDFIHSVDSLKIAKAISEEVQDTKILLQLNNANEEQKFGFSKAELLEQFDIINTLKGIEVVGLMNMAPINATDDELERLFADVAQTAKQLNLKEVSMGMSNDYKIAARAGATMLRIGTGLFK
jgi:pyridoxal phosphate enzyme (YggS family)